jgi:chemotaxis protein MotB
MSGSRGRGRRQKHVEPEEHENHERWLVTYADMLTLLMVLFIVMFAMSQVDQEKYNALKNGLADGFGADASVMTGSDSILEEKLDEISPQATEILDKLSDADKEAVAKALGTTQTGESASYAAARVEYDRLEKVRRKIVSALSRKGLTDDVRTAIDERGLVVSLVSKHVVFQPDVAQLSPRGQQVVDTLAPVLRGLTEQLRIDGHTNQVKVHPRYFATDWDLSAARAVTVLRRLNERNHVPAGRLSVSAFGHERPLVDPALPRSQDVNKRVDIVVLPDVDSDTQQLLDDVAADTASGGTSAAGKTGTGTETGEASNDAGREIDHETVTRKDGDGDDNEHG